MTEPNLPDLKPQYLLFANEYLKCFNETKAAVAAGFAETSARNQGYRLMKRDDVRAYIRARLSQSAMEADEVLYHLAQIARGDMDDLIDLHGNVDVSKAQRLGKTNLIKRVKNKSITTEESDINETEVEGYDRLKALELLGKHYALFTDKVQAEVIDWRSKVIEQGLDPDALMEEFKSYMLHAAESNRAE